MLELKANFLTLVRQDTKILKDIYMDEKPYGREKQVQFVKRTLDNELFLDFLPNGKISIIRNNESVPTEYIDVYSIQDAYKQVRYFANNGRLKGGIPL